MKVKIKDKDKLVDATIEVVNGVMIVSPKEEKVDITKFKDGDVITCGHNDCGGFQWTAILQGEIESIADIMFIGDYCSLDCTGEFLDHNSGSDASTWVRYATEEEKKKLFDKLKEEGYEFDFDKKELVRLMWKPKCNEAFYFPSYECGYFESDSDVYLEDDKDLIDEDIDVVRGWVFRTEEECEQFCKKLNKAIEGVKP